MNHNEYSLAGWSAVAAAVLTLPMVGLSLAMDLMGLLAPYVLPPLVVVTVAQTACAMYAFWKLRTLLNQRYDFHAVDTLIPVIIWGVALIMTLGLSGRMVFYFGLVPDKAMIVAAGLLMVVGLPLSVLVIVFAVRLLRLGGNLNGYLKPYVYITIAAAICFASGILMPVGMLLEAATSVILAMVFLQPATEEPTPEFV